ncbi:2'-5' RNA ligase family protein [Jatrophihabitans sp. YIM 134969]
MTGPGLVTAVVCAAFDAATDAAVLAVRDAVARTGVRLPARPRHRPHLTLAAVRVHPEQLDGVVDLARDLAARSDPVRFRLSRVGTFGRAGALWLGPDDPTDLCTLQRSVYAAVVAGPWPAAFVGRSEPDTWVPHCSLATRLDRVTLERVRREITASFAPLDATVDALAVIVVAPAATPATSRFSRSRGGGAAGTRG